VAELYDLAATTIDGRTQSMRDYAGRVLLVVNVASGCAYTPQYAALEALWRRHRAAGLTVLGFPCDQFGHQEPGTEAEIAAFCSTMYDVTFPLFAKLDVNGRHAHPVFRHLKRERPGTLRTTRINWNFTKFLVDRHGHARARFGPRVAPERIEPEIVELLGRVA